ncbi:protein Wnt-4-like [Ornithodoros turicata]|uniref:protein Wnt-4-like n=1 Tax=Ornithodoros turicata TaxID=34597 RepID=UPI003139D886
MSVVVLWVLICCATARVRANWMFLGTVATAPNLECESLGLVGSQRRLCEERPGALQAVAEGNRRALAECQKLFRYDPWNCSLQGFTQMLTRGSPETAFIYAVHSAAVAHAVAVACASGHLSECSCEPARRPSPPRSWKWGGCSDNVRFGVQLARQFADAPERRKRRSDPRATVNLHNLRAGRIALSARVRMRCRCHGVSGSCELRTCWRQAPPLHVVARALKVKYWRSIPVKTRPNRLRRDGLVHLRASPDFCEPNARLGVLGTRGRICTAPEGCKRLCCGRGYETKVVKKRERCHCKFHWCCYVTCKSCETRFEQYACK